MAAQVLLKAAEELVYVQEEPSTATFEIRGSLGKVTTLLRKALADGDLEVVAELNVAERLKRTLEIETSGCTLLFVDSAVLMLEAVTLDQTVLASLPLHVVVCDRGAYSLVHVAAPSCERRVGTQPPAGQLQARLLSALGSIGMRLSPYDTLPP